jgi:hypothetical protein
MKITLNDKYPFFNIGKVIFLNFENPSIDIDVSILSDGDKKILLNSVQRQVVSVDKMDLLLDTPAQQSKVIEPKVELPVLKDVLLEDDNEKELKSFLAGSVNTVKKNLASLSISKLKKIHSLESNGKKRAQILSAIKVYLDKHTDEVKQNVSKVITMANDRGNYENLNINSDHVSEIEETDEIVVTVPLDK